MSTLASESATARTRSSTRVIVGLRPTIGSSARSRWSDWRSSAFSCRSRRSSSIFLNVTTIWSLSKGFRMYSNAPFFVASTADSMVPNPVMMTTSVSGRVFFTNSRSWIPLTPGI
jgi:hypothetical protein